MNNMLRKYALALVVALIAPAAHAAVCVSENAVAAPPVVSGTAMVGQVLSTTNGGWTNNPTSFTYQWAGNGTLIGGAAANAYTPVVGDIGHTITSLVTATNAGGVSCDSVSAPTTAVVAAVSTAITNTSVPVITGTAQVGQTLSSSTGVWTNVSGTATYGYQWFTNASGSYEGRGTVSQTTAKAHYEVTVGMATNYSNNDGIGFSSAAHALTTTGGFLGNDSASLGWFGDGNLYFNNATLLAANNGTRYKQGDTLAIEIDFTGKLIWVKNVTQAGNWNNSGTANPSTGVGGLSIAAVTGSPWFPSADLRIYADSYTANFGATTFAQALSTGFSAWGAATTWNPTDRSYVALSNSNLTVTGEALGTENGAIAATYVPVTGDVGHALSVVVVASDKGIVSSPATSATTANVIAAVTAVPVNSVLPVISGTAQVGSTLTTTNGTWTNTPTGYAYQWKSAGNVIPGATGTTYVPVTSDVGNTITVSVVASNNGGQSAAATSVATSAVIAAATTSITIGWTPTTTPTFGQTVGSGFLNATGGVASGGAVLGSSATIQSISVYVTAASGNILLGIYDNTGTGGTPGAKKAATASTLLTAGWNTIPVVTPTLLSAGTYWFLIAADNNVAALGNGTGTAGHTYLGGQTYALPATAPSLTNAATPSIAVYGTLTTAGGASVPINTALPTISGTPQVGQTLTASPGIWANTPTLPYQYQWNSSGVASAANFSTAGGKITGPDGKVWHGQGAGVLDQEITGDIGTASGSALATRMMTLLPGMNLVRVANYVLNTPSKYQAFVNTMTAAHVVVVFEPHNVNGINTVNTGANLTTENNWFIAMANQFMGNPYVWFQTNNEPGSGDSTEQQSNYNAIRGTGSNVPVIFEAGLGANGNPSDLTASVYTTMHNVAWDLHAYDWMSGKSTSLAAITADANNRIAAMQALTSADGTMPVICLETGNSTDGKTVDPGGFQEVQATFANPNFVGASAWIFDSLYSNTPPDNLTNPGGTTLNAFGMQVASYTADGASTFPASSGPISGATTSTYVPVLSDVGNSISVSVIAFNATGASVPATSAATGSVTPAGVGSGGTKAARTADLQSTMGISGHVGSYANNTQTVADAAYLGIGKWRDGISGLAAGTLTVYQGLVNGGIQIIGLPWLPTDNTFPGNVTGAKSVLALGPTPQGTRALFAVEGPNEPGAGFSPFTYNGFNSATTWQGVSQWQHGWYAAVKADATIGTAGANIPVTTPTLVGAEPDNWGLQYLTVPAGPPAGVLAAAGLTYADWYNFHIYPLIDGIPSAQWIDPTQGDHFVNHENADFVSTYLHSFAGSSLASVQAAPRIITETNLMTTPAPSAGGTTVDKPTQGKDVLNGFMNAWNEGFSAFCIYTFYPFSGDGTELFSAPATPYVSATYIHNFTTALHDAGGTAFTFTPGSLAYTLAGLPSTAKAILFEKANGTFELVIWNNVTNWNKGAGTPIAISPTAVTVNFGAAHGTVNVYDPTAGTTAVATAANANTMNVSLKDYPMVVEVIN